MYLINDNYTRENVLPPMGMELAHTDLRPLSNRCVVERTAVPSTRLAREKHTGGVMTKTDFTYR